MIKFERQLIYKIAMKKLDAFLDRAFSANSVMHGALLAVIAALLPYVTKDVNIGTIPDKAVSYTHLTLPTIYSV